MDKKKRNFGISKILLAILIWSSFYIYESVSGPVYRPPFIFFILNFFGVIIFLNGLFQVGKSRNLNKLAVPNPMVVEKKSKTSKKLIYLGSFVAVVMFLIAILVEPKNYSVIGILWAVSMFVAMFGLVGLKSKGSDKIFYLILVFTVYAGTFITWVIIGLSKWTW